MIIHSNIKEYEVVFEKETGFIGQISNYENAQYVVDKKVYDLYTELFSQIPLERLILIEANENNKVIESALTICNNITTIPAKRNAYLISIGGGIIQDITGFSANIIYRGINWIFVPTTLLAACDSCIGGKTSLNYERYKNLLGTFYPPNAIHIWPGFFDTLSDKDYKSGLGEVIKFNIMSGKYGLKTIENKIDQLIDKDPIVISEFIHQSLEYKKRFIEIDEFDRGERIKLNFAHTFGHAIEVVTEYEIPHGTAVAIGMIIANYISLQRKILSEFIVHQAEQVLLKVIKIDVEKLKCSPESYFDAIKKDKKQISESITAVLLHEREMTFDLDIVHNLKKSEIIEAILYFIELYERTNK